MCEQCRSAAKAADAAKAKAAQARQAAATKAQAEAARKAASSRAANPAAAPKASPGAADGAKGSTLKPGAAASKVGKAGPGPTPADPTRGPGAAAAANPASSPKTPHRLRIDLAIDPRAATAVDDRFTLTSHDGAYRKTLTVKDDKVPGDDQVTLEFTDLLEGRKYTFEVDYGKEGGRQTMFKDAPFAALVA